MIQYLASYYVFVLQSDDDTRTVFSFLWVIFKSTCLVGFREIPVSR